MSWSLNTFLSSAFEEWFVYDGRFRVLVVLQTLAEDIEALSFVLVKCSPHTRVTAGSNLGEVKQLLSGLKRVTLCYPINNTF